MNIHGYSWLHTSIVVITFVDFSKTCLHLLTLAGFLARLVQFNTIKYAFEIASELLN